MDFFFFPVTKFSQLNVLKCDIISMNLLRNLYKEKQSDSHNASRFPQSNYGYKLYSLITNILKRNISSSTDSPLTLTCRSMDTSLSIMCSFPRHLVLSMILSAYSSLVVRHTQPRTTAKFPSPRMRPTEYLKAIFSSWVCFKAGEAEFTLQ